MSWAEAGDKAAAELAVSKASIMALVLMCVMGWLRLGHDGDSNTAPRSKVPVAAARPRLSPVSPQNTFLGSARLQMALRGLPDPNPEWSLLGAQRKNTVFSLAKIGRDCRVGPGTY